MYSTVHDSRALGGAVRVVRSARESQIMETEHAASVSQRVPHEHPLSLPRLVTGTSPVPQKWLDVRFRRASAWIAFARKDLPSRERNEEDDTPVCG
jgi:hypothetical protein